MPTENAIAEEIRCSGCEEVVSDVTEVDDQSLCETCLDAEYFFCGECENMEHRSELSNWEYTWSGRIHSLLCQSCADNHFFCCDDCETIRRYSDSTEVNGRTVCPSCLDEYYSCYDCGEYISSDDSRYCDSCGNTFCADCSCSCEESGSAYFSSRTITMTHQVGTEPGEIVTIPHLVGVELEAEAVGSGRGYVNDHVPKSVGITEDGSLDDGVECQTPPASLDKLETVVTDTVKGLKKCGYGVTNSCGLHIHLDGRGLDARTVRNFLRLYLYLEDFIYSTLPNHRRTGNYSMPLGKRFSQKDFAGIASLGQLERIWYEGHDRTEMLIRAVRHIRDNGSNEEKNLISSCSLYGDISSWPQPVYELASREWRKKYKYLTAGMKREKYHSSRYLGVNMQSFFYRQTIELRHHSGTLNRKKILSWIQLNLLILKKAKNAERGLFTKLENEKDEARRFAIFARSVGMPAKLKKYFMERRKKFSKTGITDND